MINFFVNRKLLYALFALIFFQNAFVLSIGGSIKWYEIISVICFIYILISKNHLSFNKFSILLFLLFIISPLISDSLSILLKPFEKNIYDQYAIRFPEVQNNLRTNYFFSLNYNLILSFGCFAVLYYTIKSNYIYNNYLKVVRLFVCVGTFVAFYSLYQFIGMAVLKLPDIVPSLLDARNYRGGQFRVGGFSTEPGSYVFIQTITVMYLLIHKNIFTVKKQKRLLWFNLIVLFLTMSSSLLISLFCIFIYLLFFSKVRMLRIFCIVCIIMVLLFFPIINKITNNLLYYTFITKIQNYITIPDNTLDSGAMRSYTARIGYEIFKKKPLFGCGLGNSIFYMHQYEYTMGIKVWGERLYATVPPQNNVSKIFAEQGIFGFSCFIILLLKSIGMFYKYRKDNYSLCYFIISLFLLFVNFTAGIYVTNLFIWLNLSLGINYIYHKYMGTKNGTKL